MDEDSAASSHGRPCVSCRKRKVRCDKIRPCSNCAKAKQLCTYESPESNTIISSDIRTGNAQTDGDLRERLARLESLMAKMMVGESVASPEGSDRGPNQTSPARQLVPPTPPAIVEQPGAPVGQILFQEGYSAYFDSDFWPGLISEIEDLRRLFDAPQTPTQDSSWISSSALGLGATIPMPDLSLMQPALAESNMLCRLYFENVNPFVILLHQSHFGRELDQFRRGTFEFPHEYEALLFCIYLLAVNGLRPEVVQTTFSTPKPALVARFQHAAQIALARANFFATDKVLVLHALLHYLVRAYLVHVINIMDVAEESTFLFQQNLAREAVALLGNAARTAQNMGIHRDPSHFPYSPWICELRRRAWNYLCCLDALAMHSYGAESSLPPTADAQPPKNANGSEWHASRFAKPASVPQDIKGFKETTFVLARREIADLIVRISKLDPEEFAAKDRLIRQTKANLDEKYLNEIDRTNPSQTVVAAMIEVSLSSLRLTLRHRRTMQATAATRDGEKYDEFIAALELLEAIEYHITTFAPLNWEWVFQTVVPWLPTAIVLTYLPHAHRKLDIDRAQKQIHLVFGRNSDPANPMSKCPRWLLLMRLREQMNQTGSQMGTARNVTSGQGIQDSTLVLTDDLMLDFGAAGQMELLGDEMNFQDMEDLPWLSAQMPL